MPTNTLNSFLNKFFLVVFLIGLLWSVWQMSYVLLSPVQSLQSCAATKLGLFALQLQLAVLWGAGLFVLFFPPTAYWKYWSWFWCFAGGGVLMYWWVQYLHCDLPTVNRYEDLTIIYSLFIWAYVLWGMFVSYLTPTTRRKYAYGYWAGVFLLCYLASQYGK